MFVKSPIRNKLLVGLGLLLVIVAVLSWGGMHGLYAYRSLVRSLARRVDELPLANHLSQNVSNLRVGLAETRAARQLQLPGLDTAPLSVQLGREQFRRNLDAVKQKLDEYSRQIRDNNPEEQIGDSRRERLVVEAMEASLARIDESQRAADWLLDDVKHGKLSAELAHLQEQAGELPTYLHDNIREFTEEAKGQYRTLIALTWITSGTTAVILALLVRLFYQWIFCPLRVLIKGSRRVASGSSITVFVSTPAMKCRSWPER
nr:sensor histidine kinase [uncultured bacterium]